MFLLTLHWHVHLSKVPGQVAVCNRLVRVAHPEAFRRTPHRHLSTIYCSRPVRLGSFAWQRATVPNLRVTRLKSGVNVLTTSF
jgi:hypothetical protein